MKNSYIILLFFINFGYGQTASFIIPDTVCVNQNITIQNTTVSGSSFYWNFCSGNLATTPIGQNLGNQGSLSGPVYIALAKDGNQYFSFITNHNGGSLTRNYYGNSYSNSPVSVNLGNLGVIGNQVEGIQIKKDNNGNWYGLIVGGVNNDLIRLNFGNFLLNTPTTNWLGNIGSTFNYPHTIYTFQEGGNWYSFIGNYGNSNLLKLNFGNSLTNTPTSVNFGNIGGLNGPVGFCPIQKNGIWYLFVVNRDNNTISRLNFGNSLLNIPTGVNLGNIGSLATPRSITLIQDCDQIFGFVVNETANDIVRVTFPNGITSNPVGSSLGNIANFSFPHQISEVFRVGDTLYALIANVSNSTLSRIYFPSCSISSIPSSTLQNPPSFSYNLVGTYNISLVVNQGLPTQSNICKDIVVVDGVNVNLGNDTSICLGNSLTLNAGNPGCNYVWSTGQTSQSITVTIPGTYIVKVNNAGGCISNDTINVNVSNSINVNLGNDTTICQGSSFSLNAGNPGCTYLWNNTQTTQNIDITTSGTYIVQVTTSAGCLGKDTIIVNFSNSLNVNLGNDTTICQGSSFSLNAGNPGCTYLWNNMQISQNIDITTSGIYIVQVTNSAGCSVKDTIIVNFSNSLNVNLGNDTTICIGESVILNSGYAGASYLWNTNAISQTINVVNAGNYWVDVNSNGCIGSDSIIINTIPKPIISLGNDTIMCPDELIVLTPGLGFNNYLWSNGANTSSINVNIPGNYSVNVSNGVCFISDEIFIDECGSEIWIPNVFTPNSDGLNEFFFPVCTNIDKITMYIFNRWGNQLYEGSGKSLRWDGKYLGNLCPDGVYYYLIEYESKGRNKGMHQKHGSVTLLR